MMAAAAAAVTQRCQRARAHSYFHKENKTKITTTKKSYSSITIIIMSGFHETHISFHI
jgi:hypothetical protein